MLNVRGGVACFLVSLAMEGTSLASPPRLAAVVVSTSEPATALPDPDRRAVEEVWRRATADALGPSDWVTLAEETTLRVMADNGIDPAGACESSCSLDLARELKAAILFSGLLMCSGDRWLLLATAFASDTGRQLASADWAGDSLPSLLERVRREARGLAGTALSSLPDGVRRTTGVSFALADSLRGIGGLRVSLFAGGRESSCTTILQLGRPCLFASLPEGPARFSVRGSPAGTVAGSVDLLNGHADFVFAGRSDIHGQELETRIWQFGLAAGAAGLIAGTVAGVLSGSATAGGSVGLVGAALSAAGGAWWAWSWWDGLPQMSVVTLSEYQAGRSRR